MKKFGTDHIIKSKQASFAKTDENIKDLTREMAKGGGIAFLGSITGRIGGFVLQVLLAKVLGSIGYGLYALGISITGIVQVVSSLGLQYGVVRFVSMHIGEESKEGVKGTIYLAMKLSLICSVIASAILFFLSDEIAERLFDELKLNVVLKILAIAIPFYVMVSMVTSFAQATKCIKYQVALQDIFRPLVNISLVCFLFLLGFRLTGALYCFMVSGVLTAGLGFYYLWKLFPDIISKAIKPLYNTKRLLRFSLPTFMALISYSMLNYIDRIMLGYFGNPEDVGIYNAAAIVAMQLLIFLNAFIVIFSPMVSDLYNRRKFNELKKLFNILARWLFTLTIPLFILLLVFSKSIMYVFGLNFLIGWKVLVLLASAQLINTVTGPVGMLLQMSGKQDLELLNGIVVFLLNIGLNLWLIPIHGIVGAAIATAISFALINIVKITEVMLLYKIFPYDFRYAKPIIAGFAMTVVIYFAFGGNSINLPDWILAITTSTVGLVVYGGIIYLAGITNEDTALLLSFKNKFLRVVHKG